MILIDELELLARTHFTVTAWFTLSVVTAVALGTDLFRVAAELWEPVNKATASDTSTAKRKMCKLTPEGSSRLAQNVSITLSPTSLGLLDFFKTKHQAVTIGIRKRAGAAERNSLENCRS